MGKTGTTSANFLNVSDLKEEIRKTCMPRVQRVSFNNVFRLIPNAPRFVTGDGFQNQVLPNVKMIARYEHHARLQQGLRYRCGAETRENGVEMAVFIQILTTSIAESCARLGFLG